MSATPVTNGQVWHRRALALAALLTVPLLALQAARAAAPPSPTVSPGPVPRATCGPGSLPETGTQGRVSTAEVASGRAQKGYLCNTQVVGHLPGGSNFKTLRYVDPAGHECAYFDTAQADAARGTGGVHVVDMAAPRRPKLTTRLTTPAMLSPHESLLLNAKRGLLVATMGAPGTAPGFLDVYDLTKDCRNPVLLSSSPIAILGHESGFAPDGRTFYAASTSNGTGFVAIDLTDPASPEILAVHTGVVLHGMRLSADGNLLYAVDLDPRVQARTSALTGTTPGLRIFDVSQVQQRRPSPQIAELGTLDWPEKSYPQVAEPVTIRGHRYVLEIDEFGSGEHVGAARMISVHDPRRPRLVSNIRLEVHLPAAQAGDQQGDATSEVTGYSGHYCAVPRMVDPGIAACSFIRSGLRVFDIRDPKKPREIAYFNPPGQDGGNTKVAPAFVPERNEIWYTDAASGFWAVKVTNGVWPRR